MRQFSIIYFVLAIVICAISCVQSTTKRTVHVELDATNISEPASIGIRGQLPPLSWQQNYPLEDPDGDGIYTGTLVFDIPYDFVEVKFVLNENEYELKGQPNRRIQFEDRDSLTYRAVFDQ